MIGKVITLILGIGVLSLSYPKSTIGTICAIILILISWLMNR